MPPALARFLLRLLGWRVRYEGPGTRRYVLIGYPHTSNWDFPYTLLALWAMRVPARWVGKHTLFRGPAGPIMRALGGVPLDRERTSDFVSQVARRFEEAKRKDEELVIVLAPEGTRSRVERWRTGFYYIAKTGGVPIALGYLDYGRREAGIGGTVHPSDDLESDMDRIRAFYRGKRGRRPELAGEIRAR